MDDRLFPLKWQLFNDAKSHNDQAVEVAGAETRAALFGDSPPGKAMTAASLREISRQDVDAYRRRLFDPDGAIVTLYGNITAQHAVPRCWTSCLMGGSADLSAADYAGRSG